MKKSTISITLPDGSTKKHPSGTTPLEIAGSIGKKLAADSIAAEVNGELKDMTRPITEDAELKLHTFDSEKGREVFWHSSAHLLAQAVLRLYPESLLTIGPAIETGFYYDISHKPFSQKDLEKIEKEMTKITEENFEVKRTELSTEEAKKKWENNKYKLEIIESESEKGQISAYEQGEFTDLCRGPHAPSTGMLKAVKLTKVSSAYWKGDQKNDELQRIYGVSFPDKKQLKKHLQKIEAAEQNDHRKIGKELDLFWFHEWSPGSPFFLPKGTIIYNELQKFLREEYSKRGYEEIITPQMFNKELWELSGHWQHYRENMFVLEVDSTEFSLKPMNCPSHVLMFKSKARSYRDLPMRIADFCYLHRNELRGVLGGLTRVRKFSQDDAHIFCTEDQAVEELNSLVIFAKHIYQKIFGFPMSAKLSTRPEKHMGEPEVWDRAENQLEEVLKKNSMEYGFSKGEGAFYGPKIDIFCKDALGREHQLVTIQLDFQMPKRMGAEYEGSDGKKHTAVMIHRALIGSFERFMGLLIEHYGGKFPLWISPVQVKILTVADRFNKNAEELAEKCRENNMRAEIDSKSESISHKVREAQLQKVNYIVVIGEKEAGSSKVTVRIRDSQKIVSMETEEFLSAVKEEADLKKQKSILQDQQQASPQTI